jgi:TolB-like protein
VAVLPLQNLSNDKEQEYFAEGMTDQLITDLAKVGSLRVISRTSTMRYQGTHTSLAQIARELNVDALIEGAVMRSGDRIRITAQLIRALPEQHLWSESYERNLRDVLALQSDGARAIVREVRAKLTTQEEALLKAGHPVNPKTYELYLKGRHYANQRTEVGLKKSRDYLQQAIDADPDYALAYAGLATSYDLLGGYSLLPARDVFPKASFGYQGAGYRRFAGRGTRSSGIRSALLRLELGGSEAELKQSIRLNPSSATAHEIYSLYYDTIGQTKESIAEMERARELDPLSLDINAQLGVVYRDGRYYDRAIEQCRKTIELDQNFSPGHLDPMQRKCPFHDALRK